MNKVNEIIQASEKATPGPWQPKNDEYDWDEIIGNVDSEYVDGVAEHTYESVCTISDDDSLGNANAAFIVLACNNAKSLATALLAAEALAPKVQAVIDRWESPNWSNVAHTRDFIWAMRDELAALRSALNALGEGK